jgi:hypothetical protein
MKLIVLDSTFNHRRLNGRLDFQNAVEKLRSFILNGIKRFSMVPGMFIHSFKIVFQLLILSTFFKVKMTTMITDGGPYRRRLWVHFVKADLL